MDNGHSAPAGEWTLCSECHATAVYDQADAQRLYRDVIRSLTGRVGLSLNVPTGLVLVTQAQLAEIVRQQDDHDGGDLAHTLGLYARRGIKRGIYVRAGLPRTLFIQVAAHEWGHAWQGENCPLLNDPLVREGFAEWMAYKALATLGAQTAMAHMAAREDVYGQGLRRALAVEEADGEAGVVAWCRQ